MPEGTVHAVPLLPFEGREMTDHEAERAAVDVFAATLDDMDDDEVQDEDVEPAEEASDDEPEEVTADAEDGDEPDPEQTPELTPEEREKGYLREQDYHRKTEALATERRSFEAEREAAKAELSAAKAKLEQEATEYATRLAAIVDKEPTAEQWDELRQRDPAEYAAARADWAAAKAEHREAAEKAAALQQERQAEFDRQLSEAIQAERVRLTEAVPEWKDEAKRTADLQALFAEAKTAFGFSDQELANVHDHRLIVLLRDAAAYRELKAKGAALVDEKKRAPVLKPGSRDNSPRTAKTEFQQVRARLAKTGDVKDAAHFFEHLLGDK